MEKGGRTKCIHRLITHGAGIEGICKVTKVVTEITSYVPDKTSGKRRQNIRIKYAGLGFIPLDELMKTEEWWRDFGHAAIPRKC